VHLLRRYLGPLLITLLLASACGGENSVSPTLDDPPADTSDTSNDDVAQPTDELANQGPINGSLISVPAFGLGLFGIDRVSGQPTALLMDSTEFVDRNVQPFSTDQLAHTLGYIPLEGQAFSHDVQLVRIDLISGQASVIAVLGQDRANDDDTNLRQWEIIGTSESAVWITEGNFADTEKTFISFDPNTGAELARFSPGEARLFDPIVVGESIFARENNAVVEVAADGTSTTRLAFESGGATALNLLFPNPADLAKFLIVEGGAIATDEAIERAFSFNDAPVSHLWATDGESLWWTFSDTTTLTTGEFAVIAGIMRYNLTSEVIDAWPLGDMAVEFEENNVVNTLSQPDLVVRDGKLWIVDGREDGQLHQLDPDTGTIASFDVGREADVDYTSIEAISNDPESLWLKTTRYVITNAGDDGSRSSVGEIAFERIDPTTGAAVVSVAGPDLNGR
jgi:hypothetical protein